MELETFKITVLPLREKLINISWRMMEDRSDAEDIVQETFLKLWQIREKLDGYNSVEALAVQVAKNLALDKLKQHGRQGWISPCFRSIREQETRRKNWNSTIRWPVSAG